VRLARHTGRSRSETKTAPFDAIALDANNNTHVPTEVHAPQLIHDHHGAAQGRSSPTASAASMEHRGRTGAPPWTRCAATSYTDAARGALAATTPTEEGRPAKKGEAWQGADERTDGGGTGTRRRRTMARGGGGRRQWTMDGNEVVVDGEGQRRDGWMDGRYPTSSAVRTSFPRGHTRN
jgi:hypothetical protein